MRIVQILPGSGDRFYCENCVRDNALVRALRDAGHEVVVAPLYLPQGLESPDGVTVTPVFFGGINTYLQQEFALFRKTPRWVDAIFDSAPMLAAAARRAGSVRASELGPMTLSVLKGAEGRQSKELARLVEHLAALPRPDVVHLSSALLLGIGAALKDRLGVPLVCSLQDEDTWLDAMEEPDRGLCWAAMSAAARRADALTAPSRHFADRMRERMKLESVHVVPIGVEAGPVRPEPAAPAVGFLARLSESLGLGLLADAYRKLRSQERFRDLRLHLCGGGTADDEPYLEELRESFGGFDGIRIFGTHDRRAFLESVTVLSVPTPGGLAFGTFLLEAMAAGVPVVEPRVGSFPEVLEAAGGGVLYEPNDAATLAGALGGLLTDAPRRAELAARGREGVVKHFGLRTMAEGMLNVYRSVVPSAVASR